MSSSALSIINNSISMNFLVSVEKRSGLKVKCKVKIFNSAAHLRQCLPDSFYFPLILLSLFWLLTTPTSQNIQLSCSLLTSENAACQQTALNQLPTPCCLVSPPVCQKIQETEYKKFNRQYTREIKAQYAAELCTSWSALLCSPDCTLPCCSDCGSR